MGQGKIAINERGIVLVEANDGEIWMLYSEIEELFDIYDYSVKKNIKALFKSGALWEEDVYRVRELPNGRFAEEYNLEMIIALAFRIWTRNAEILRKWIMRKVARHSIDMAIFVKINSCRIEN